LHNEDYRSRYQSALAIDFPRVPVEQDPARFQALSQAGLAIRNLDVGHVELDAPSLGRGERLNEMGVAELCESQGFDSDLARVRLGAYSIVSKWVSTYGRDEVRSLLERLSAAEEVRARYSKVTIRHQ
jgi:hypothetical protein